MIISAIIVKASTKILLSRYMASNVSRDPKRSKTKKWVPNSNILNIVIYQILQSLGVPLLKLRLMTVWV